jgi:hypothetical protein
MARIAFFIAVLLAPLSALSASPTANLSVNVVPAGGGGVGCTPSGPGTDAADDVAAAGFTTCALYNDFTTAIPNTVGTGLANNWLDCSYSDDSGAVWYFSKNFVNPAGSIACASGSSASSSNSAVYQTNDGGTLALDLHATGTGCSSYGGDLCDIAMSSIGYNDDTQAPNPGMFGNAYQEFTWRVTQSVASASYWSYSDYNETCRNGATTNCGTGGWGANTIEEDFMECCSNPLDGAYLSWSSSGGATYLGGPCCGGDGLTAGLEVNYHTWAVLQTGNGSGNYRLRWYLDGTRIYDTGLQTYPYSSEYNSRRELITISYARSATTQDLFLRSAKVITCASWQNADSSGMCNVSNP